MLHLNHVQRGRLPLEVFRSLAESVVRQAVADLHHAAFRDDARRFFDSRSFDAYCEILGWNTRRARENLHARLDDLMYPQAPASGKPQPASTLSA